MSANEQSTPDELREADESMQPAPRRNRLVRLFATAILAATLTTIGFVIVSAVTNIDFDGLPNTPLEWLVVVALAVSIPIIMFVGLFIRARDEGSFL